MDRMAQRRGSGSRDDAPSGRPIDIDELPDPLPPVVLVVGDEELLVTRAVSSLAAAVRRAHPDVVETERAGSEIEGPELHELLGPSLFGDARLLIVRSAQDLRTGAQDVLRSYLEAPADGSTVVLQHAGGAKGKAVLTTARANGAGEISCAGLSRASERADFVRAEVRRAGGRIAPDAVTALVDAVGSDLRELAATSAQLVSDSGGTVDVDLVRAYHQGRAEVSGFAVSDLAVVGNVPGALEALRYAINLGVPHVVIADALADGVRTIARVASAGRGSEYELAKKLGMQPWKVRRAQSQSRGWSETGVRHALRAVALLNADVKGEAADPAWALERAVRRLGQARAVRAS
jgi:DNA polymerase-3 subunit delta